MHRLRWKLCQIWGVPADDECFTKISPAQWKWYYYNHLEDNNIEVERERDLIEYQVSFFEPKAIREIVSERQAKQAQETNIPIEPKEGQISSGLDLKNLGNILDLSDRITRSQRHEKDATIYNFDHWLNINLG